MHSGSKILGKCNIGDNAVISANSYIKDQDVPEGALVFGASPNLVFKHIGSRPSK
jgi:serine O-acetyltransferase